MLDLEEKPDHQGCSAGQVDDSGTSSSSVLNGEALADVADEASCYTRPPAAFEFCILKSCSTSAEGENEVEEEIEEDGISGVPQQPRLITWQLFPPASVAPGVSQQSMLASSSPSFCQADAPSEEQQELQQQVKPVRKRRRGPQSRSSQYRGVTFYRRTGRWESHIWDCGKQLYLGGFDTADAAARAYDRAAIRFRGVHADINFNLSDYEEDLKLMKDLSKEEFIYILRRQSSGVATGRSKYRGATLHMCGRWQAGMELSPGKNAYDKAAAAVKCNGRKAVTNAEPRVYEAELFSVADTEGLDVDLSLRISQPVVHSPKGGQNPLVRQFEASYAGKSKKRPEVVLQAPPIWCPGTNRPSPFPLLSSASASASKVIAALPSLQSPPSTTRYLHFSQQATLNQYLKNRNQ